MAKEIDSPLSPVLSNLSKAAEKQHLYTEAELFNQLALKLHAPGVKPNTLQHLRDSIAADLEERYPGLQSLGEEVSDRGVLRALRWGQKVTTIQKTLIDRYVAKGDSLLEGLDLYVCEACGFIFLGQQPPDICPVCKAPHRRFSKVK